MKFFTSFIARQLFGITCILYCKFSESKFRQWDQPNNVDIAKPASHCFMISMIFDGIVTLITTLIFP